MVRPPVVNDCEKLQPARASLDRIQELHARITTIENPKKTEMQDSTDMTMPPAFAEMMLTKYRTELTRLERAFDLWLD